MSSEKESKWSFMDEAIASIGLTTGMACFVFAFYPRPILTVFELDSKSELGAALRVVNALPTVGVGFMVLFAAGYLARRLNR